MKSKNCLFILILLIIPMILCSCKSEKKITVEESLINFEKYGYTDEIYKEINSNDDSNGEEATLIYINPETEKSIYEYIFSSKDKALNAFETINTEYENNSELYDSMDIKLIDNIVLICDSEIIDQIFK